MAGDDDDRARMTALRALEDVLALRDEGGKVRLLSLSRAQLDRLSDALNELFGLAQEVLEQRGAERP